MLSLEAGENLQPRRQTTGQVTGIARGVASSVCVCVFAQSELRARARILRFQLVAQSVHVLGAIDRVQSVSRSVIARWTESER